MRAGVLRPESVRASTDGIQCEIGLCPGTFPLLRHQRLDLRAWRVREKPIKGSKNRSQRWTCQWQYTPTTRPYLSIQHLTPFSASTASKTTLQLPSIPEVITHQPPLKCPLWPCGEATKKMFWYTKALHFHIDLALSQPPNNWWKRCLGCPRERWMELVGRTAEFLQPTSGDARSAEVTATVRPSLTLRQRWTMTSCQRRISQDGWCGDEIYHKLQQKYMNFVTTSNFCLNCILENVSEFGHELFDECLCEFVLTTVQ